jgi:hypothetical protein
MLCVKAAVHQWRAQNRVRNLAFFHKLLADALCARVLVFCDRNDNRTAQVDEVLDIVVSAELENVPDALHVALDEFLFCLRRNLRVQLHNDVSALERAFPLARHAHVSAHARDFWIQSLEQLNVFVAVKRSDAIALRDKHRDKVLADQAGGASYNYPHLKSSRMYSATFSPLSSATFMLRILGNVT